MELSESRAERGRKPGEAVLYDQRHHQHLLIHPLVGPELEMEPLFLPECRDATDPQEQNTRTHTHKTRKAILTRYLVRRMEAFRWLQTLFQK